MLLVEYADGRVAARNLPSGCHIVTNRPLGETPDEPKVARAWRLLYDAGLWPAERGVDAPVDLVARLVTVLSDQGRVGRDAICLHGGRYGTRSAAVWRVAPPDAPAGRARIALAFADGPPCSTRLATVSPARVDEVEAPG